MQSILFKNIYLVDFENVGSTALSNVKKLKNNDEVILFYTDKSNKIPIDLHVLINESCARFEYIYVSSGGKNALDFQLSTYLGSIVATNKAQNYNIVSYDKGFEYVIDYWKRRNQSFSIKLISAIS